MKLTIVCRSFNNMAGGIERMAIALLNEMAARGHEVSLLTWDKAGAQAFYDMDERIDWRCLDLGGHKQKAGWALRFRRMRRMREIFKDLKPDVVLAFQHGTFLSTRLYTIGQGFPVIAAEREAPARFEHLRAGKWQALIFQSFRLARAVTVQCESYRQDYPRYLRDKIVSIPNPVFPAQIFARPEGAPNKRKQLLCVGRLGYQKNQSVLIEAFTKLAEDFPHWDLLLAGEGGDRETLETLVKKRDLQDRIALPGAAKDVAKLYAESHLFCLPARWEGFPNVIAESLSHGLPAVGFAGCAGVSDLLKDEETGLLAAGNNNADTLAQALRTLMAQDDHRAAMGKAGIEDMKQYAPERIFDRWENFLTQITGRSKS